MEDVTRPVPTLLGATSVAVGVAIHLTRMITAVTVSCQYKPYSCTVTFQEHQISKSLLYLIISSVFYFTLSDVNECSTENGGCEHTCTDTTGSFVCSCSNGYFLEGNGLNCTGKIVHKSP